jgi:2-polyprenyl-6-methoxyphenol hydroxylase-like FAD-dependent oxidoreductase
MRRNPGLRRGHAVVMGGSMAGLLMTRVLSEHFERVTLLERDTLPLVRAHRRGVPQGQHTHGLLASGRETLDRLFPGFSRELTDAGAVPGDIVRDVRWFFEGGLLARPETDLEGLMSTRPLLEAGVRARVRAIANVTVRDGCHVTTVIPDDERTRVNGVTLLTGETIAADLVVDTTGRGTRAPHWLKSLGFAAPEEERIHIGLSYVTRFFRRDPRHLGGDAGTIIPPTPSGKRGGVMIAQEGGLWTVTLIAHFVEPAGADLERFRAFAALLPSPDIHDVVRTAEPAGDAVTARFPASVRRRYERLTRFPEGFVVAGDAICSFNPIYGQGMSVSALEALALGEVLASGDTAIGRRFFKKAARVVDGPWTTAVGNDLRMPETIGPRTAIGNAINAYIARLQRAAHTDPALAVAFMRVANLLDHPAALFSPRTVFRVLGGGTASARASVPSAAVHAADPQAFA